MGQTISIERVDYETGSTAAPISACSEATNRRCGPREQRERDRPDKLEYFHHKNQQLGSAHSIFSKTSPDHMHEPKVGKICSKA